MTERFLECLRFVLKWEGGLSNHPDDPGGRTNKGITQSVYNSWRKEKGLPPRDVAQITDNEVRQIYFERYWTPSHAGQLPPPLDLVVFDCAVNCGVATSIRLLQKALSELGYYTDKVDGIFGNLTAQAVEKCRKDGKLPILINKCVQLRNLRYHEIATKNPRLKTFLKGWLNRTADLLRTVRAEMRA